MGKGDRRSRRGKIWRGTFGKYRPKKSKKKGGNGTKSTAGGKKKKKKEEGE